MTKPLNPIIAKMAHIMMSIEAKISKEATVYLPRQRSRFIDLTSLGLSELEDDFFTYDQIKQMVVAMVQRHEAGAKKWRIDTQHCTDDKIALVIEGMKNYQLVPVSLFMAVATASQSQMH